jgi:hypothetical protein
MSTQQLSTTVPEILFLCHDIGFYIGANRYPESCPYTVYHCESIGNSED